MSNAQPTATGTFGKTPLLHVLVSLLERRATGTLVVETTGSARSALWLESGVPTKMRLASPQARLGEILIEFGYVTRDVAAESYEHAQAKAQLFGAVLLAANVIDSETLAQALRLQLVRKLVVTSGLPGDTVFGFYEDVDYLSKWRSGPTPVSPLVVVWNLARSCADETSVATMADRIAGHPLRFHPMAKPQSFGFDRQQLEVVDVLRKKPQTLDALNRRGLVSPQTLERMVYTLTITRQLDFGRELSPIDFDNTAERFDQLLVPRQTSRSSFPAAAIQAPSPAPPTVQPRVPDALPILPSSTGNAPEAPQTAPMAPAQMKPRAAQASQPGAIDHRPTTNNDPQLKERRRQIEATSTALAGQDYFEVLGIGRDAPTQVAHEAFLKLAKLYHPDRLPEALSDLKVQATKIFARVSEAHQTLTDPLKRKAYLDGSKSQAADDETEKVRRVLRAAGSFQKAEVLFKKRMLAAAELESNRALEDDPEQPDYLALYAWIQSCKSDTEARLPELLKMVSDAVTRNPASEKNRYYRVQLLKRLGKIDEAVADCRIIVDKNPHHVDALREIRLWEMRKPAQKSGSGTKPTPGARTTSTHSRSSIPPSNSPPAARRSTPPPQGNQGGLLGRLFKR